MPKVSIISIFYNRAPFVRRSAQSLIDQTHGDYEILLVNDGSTDRTLDEMHAIAHPRVRILTHANKGFTPALRDAIAQTDNTFLAIHGSGDISLPERLSKQAAHLEANPAVGVIGCATRNTDAEGKALSVFTPDIGANPADTLLKRHIFHHGEVMYRRATYEQAGGYRPFFTFAQDHDLMCRLSGVTQFASLDDILYERVQRMEGSVSATPEKLIKQRLLAQFGAYCHRVRLAGGKDPLDEHGPSAAFLSSVRRDTAPQLLRMGLRQLRNGQFKSAARYLHYAYDFSPSALGWLAKAAANAANGLRADVKSA